MMPVNRSVLDGKGTFYTSCPPAQAHFSALQLIPCLLCTLDPAQVSFTNLVAVSQLDIHDLVC